MRTRVQLSSYLITQGFDTHLSVAVSEKESQYMNELQGSEDL